MLVARRRCIDQHGEALRQLMRELAQTVADTPPVAAESFIAERYQLSASDVARWAKRVAWSGRAELERGMLFQVIDGLLASKVLHSAPALSALSADFVELR